MLHLRNFFDCYWEHGGQSTCFTLLLVTMLWQFYQMKTLFFFTTFMKLLLRGCVITLIVWLPDAMQPTLLFFWDQRSLSTVCDSPDFIGWLFPVWPLISCKYLLILSFCHMSICKILLKFSRFSCCTLFVFFARRSDETLILTLNVTMDFISFW